jgi:hypothetical protein
MPDTALAAAFEAAGYEDPLDRIGAEAWRLFPAAADHEKRRAHVRAQLDPTTLMLFWQWQPQSAAMAIGMLLNRVKKQNFRDAARRAAEGGQPAVDNQKLIAPLTSPRDRGFAHADRAEPRPALLSQTTIRSGAAPNLTAPAQPASAAAVRAQALIARSALETVTVDGVPIGDLTVWEVRAWMRRRSTDKREAERDLRFALLLTDRLDGNFRIRDKITPAEADSYYARAEAANVE